MKQLVDPLIIDFHWIPMKLSISDSVIKLNEKHHMIWKGKERLYYMFDMTTNDGRLKTRE